MAASTNKIATKEMCYYCFDSLIHHLKRTKLPYSPTFLNDSYPLFVTWKMDGDLRGCIGTFSPLAIHDGLKEYAIESAMRDTRFNPVTMDEVKELTVYVSLLTQFEDADNYLDWEVGKHGIRIEFSTEQGSRRSATFLPEVASDMRWDKMQTIDALLKKGGIRGSINAQTRESIKLTRYQSEKVSASYADYCAFKEQQS